MWSPNLGIKLTLSMRLLQTSSYSGRKTWFSLLALLAFMTIGKSNITAQDCITSPVITCPPIFYGCLGDDISPASIGFATAVPGDANCPQPVVTFYDETTTNDLCGAGTIVKRFWRADYPNNTNPWLFAECTQVMVLKDTDAPIITDCPPDIVVGTDATCRAIVSWTPPTASDDCGLLGFTSNFGVGSEFFPGVTTVTYTATDNCGNISTCSFTITVEDNCCNDTPDLIIPGDFVGCPSSSTDPATTGQATATLTGNNCGTPTITYSDVQTSSGDCNGETLISRTWTATNPDNTNATSSGVQWITFSDNNSPTISNCPVDISIVTNANCLAVVTWPEPFASDNCGVLSLTSNFSSGSAFAPGATVVTYTALDNCGNSSTCSFTVNVIANCCDGVPSIQAPTTYTTCLGGAVDPSVAGTATGSIAGDGCDLPTITFTDATVGDGTTCGQYIQRTWRATNPNYTNQFSTAIQIINFTDEVAPVISNCPADIAITTSTTCQAVVDWTPPTASDNCGLQSLTSNFAPGTTFSPGLYTIVYTATDNCGNTSTCSFTVNVIANCCDGTPSIQVPVTYNACIGGSTDPSVTGMATGSIAGDGCAAPTITYTDVTTSSGTSCGQTIQRTWRATNPNFTNQFSTAIQIINLTDDIAPVISSCPGNIVVTTSATCLAVVNWTAPVATDNCGLQSLTSNFAPGTSFSPGVYTVVYTATDNCGNTSSCSFSVTVVANCCDGVPTIQVPTTFNACLGGSSDPSVTGTATGSIAGTGCSLPTITYSDVTTSTSACGQTIERTWKATNPSFTNQFATAVQIINLQDTSDPVISSCPANIAVVSSPNCQAVVNWTAPTAMDDCGLQSLTSNFAPGTSFGPGVYTVTYTATDNCGNTASCSFTITVQANCCDGAPTLQVPADYSGCPGTSTATATTGVATGSLEGSGCAAPTITFSDQISSNGTCGSVITRTWTAVNPNFTNQVTTGVQTIDLRDNVAPTITNCPADITVNSNGDCFAIVNWAVPSASDNCSVSSFSSDRPTGSGSRFEIGTTQITYTALDGCGNVSTCSFNVTVLSNCCSDQLVLNCPADFVGCVGVGTDPSVTGQAAATASTDCPATVTYSDQIVSQGPCAGTIVIDRTWVASRTGTTETTSCVQRITIGDNVAPVITSCIPNVNLSFEDRTYTWPDPTVSDDCSVSFTYSSPQGTTFPEGTTTVTATVSDICGNTVECSFNVTVQAENSVSGLFVSCADDIVLTCGGDNDGPVPVPQVTSECNLCQGGNIAGFVYMGELNGHRYYCSRQKMTWFDAQAFCEASGGSLAVIDDARENDFLADVLDANSAYIGLSDHVSEGVFKWVDGSPLSFSRWYPNQPNNYGNRQDFVELLRNGFWNDQDNSKPLEFIMEVSCVNITQTSGPSLLSEINETTTVSFDISDACGNTESCSYEIFVNGDLTFTCPDNIEVNADDNTEVVYFDAPTFETCCNTCNQGQDIPGFVYMGQRDGSYYYCSKDKHTWQQANEFSRRSGGNLAIIDDINENQYLAGLLENQIAFIGVSDHASEGEWRNVNGGIQRFFNWRSGNPNNTDGIQHFVELEPSGKWNDNSGAFLREYIMEIKGCGSVKQIAGIPSGGNFPIGTTTVSYEATDDCGNRKTCSFNVVVVADANSQIEYCGSGSNSSSRAFINKVQVDNLLFTSGNNGGYADNTSHCIPLQEGTSFRLTVTPGWSTYRYYAYYTIFADYNGDGDFNDTNEYIGKARSANTITGTLRVPMGAVSGATRIRVAMSLTGYPSACGANFYGETEDFCVNISPSPSDPAAKEGRSKSEEVIPEVTMGEIPLKITERRASVYPNPARDQFNLAAPEVIKKLTMIGSDGRIVRDLRNPSGAIDISDLSSGLYMIRMIDDAGLEITEKIIVE